MPKIAEYEAPDGRIFEMEVDDDVTLEQAQQMGDEQYRQYLKSQPSDGADELAKHDARMKKEYEESGAGMVLEPILRMGSEIAATGIGGIAGIGEIVRQALPGGQSDGEAPARVQQAVRDKIVLPPLSDIGTSPYNPINAAQNALSYAATLGGGTDLIAESIRGENPGPLRDATANFVGAAAPAAIGFGAPYLAGKARPYVSNIVGKIMEPHLNRATAITKRAMGDNPTAIQNIRDYAATGRNDITASQAAGPTQSRAFPALEEIVSRHPDFVDSYGNMRLAQEGWRRGLVDKLAGGRTQEGSITAQGVQNAALNAKLDPVRQDIMDRANAHVPIMKANNEKITTLKEVGASKKVIDLVTRELEKNVPPNAITAKPFLEQISRTKGEFSPSIRPHVEAVLNDLGGRISAAEKANGGYLTAQDIHQLRQAGISDAIETAMKGADTKVKGDVSRALRKFKPLSDDVINKATGTKEWSDYLRNFAKGKRVIEKMEIAQKMQKASDKNLADFGRGDSPDTLESVFGPGNNSHDLGKKMGRQAEAYREITRQLDRDSMLSGYAKEGDIAATQILAEGGHWPRIPNMLKPGIALTNAAGDIIKTGINKRIHQDIGRAMLTPQALLDLWDRAPYLSPTAEMLLNPTSNTVLTQGGLMSGDDNR